MARIKLLFFLIPGLLLCAVTGANAGKDDGRWIPYAASKKTPLDTTPDSSRYSPDLRAVMNKMKVRGITRQTARQLEASALSNTLVRVNDEGKIQTYLHVHALGAQEKALLETYGIFIEIVNEEFGLVQAWVPFDRIDDIAVLPFIKRITPPSYGTTRVGSVTTEGDAILRAAELRALGVDGSGVRVGVISDGVDSMADAQATGDLPATVTVVTHTGSDDEGTAMLEIVHDLAPGAELGFCGGLSSSLAMIDCVNDLTNVFGADIIVDDLGFFLEPYVEDGPVAQTVAGLVASGAFYTSASGNDAVAAYLLLNDLLREIQIELDVDDGGGGGCYIATAAHGSQMEFHVKSLREIRDRYLRHNAVSKSLVTPYYKYSQPVADVIARNKSLWALSWLTVVGVSGVALEEFGPAPTIAFTLLLLTLVGCAPLYVLRKIWLAALKASQDRNL